MSFQRSFHKILEEKMHQTPSATSFESSQSSVQQTDPAHLAYLMGRIGRSSFIPGTAAKSYPRPQPRPRPAHVMNASEALSFEFLKSFDNSLKESFSLQELKSAFRQAALRTHPDQGGSVQLFIELKTHYQNLLSLPAFKR